MAVTVEDMKSKLLTLDQIQDKIASTEPLGTTFLSSDSDISFRFEPDWAVSLGSKTGTESVDAAVTVNGKEFQLTKDGALGAGAVFGLTGKYAERLPSNLLESHLNYWYGDGMGGEEFNLLTGGDRAAAFAKPTIQPYSNKNLLDKVLTSIYDRYGQTPIYADYKFQHSLLKTDIRLIIPEYEREISNSNMWDIPDGKGDLWSGGLHLTNSLTGKTQTKVEGYLFRWWCTNGAITLFDEGVWSRRGNNEELDVYTWIGQAVDEVLGGLDESFTRVAALTNLVVPEGEIATIVRELFVQYDVPVSQRQPIIDLLVKQAEESDSPLTMYNIMNAVTEVANGLHPERADRLMHIGGAIPSVTIDPVKAKVWAEGHLADPTSPNPYELSQIA